jgi:putative endonuclease
MTDTRTKGMIGENQACEYLKNAGFAIIGRNFRSSAGEIDIIAQKANSLHFIEVKSWKTYSKADLEYGINNVKRRRIINTARYFLNRNPELCELPILFDIIFISKGDEIQYIQNAFSEV